MELLALVAGFAVLLWVLLDALWTTLWMEGGAGPMTHFVGNTLWSFGKQVARLGRGEFVHRRLSLGGPLIMVATIVVWLVLLWTGVWLVFSAHPEAVVDATNLEPATTVDRIWFTLYVTTTLGNGDFVPGTPVYKVLTGIMTTSGMVLLTLSVSYMFSVLAAVIDKRALATEIYALSDSTAKMVSLFEAGEGSGLSSRLSSISSQITNSSRQHAAYPILHYFHPLTSRKSAVCAIAQLDEALTLYEHVEADPTSGFDRTTLHPTRAAITDFLKAVRSMYPTDLGEPPEMPPMDRFREAGIEMSSQDIERAIGRVRERRTLLAAVVQEDAWDWSVVLHGEQQVDL